jgi:hypothetical protein
MNGLTVNLRDQYTGELITLAQGSTYNFRINGDVGSSARERFVIEMPAGTLDPVITVEGNTLTSNISAGNQWYFDGEPVDGGTGQTLVAEKSGEYTLIANANGCTKTSEPVYVTVAVTAVNEFQDWDVDVYPNPASQLLTIYLRAGATGPLFYTVHNALGMTLLRGTFESALAEGNSIDVSGLSSGVYFLNIETVGWKHRTRLLINAHSQR